jgi:hypothetical protein
MKKMPYMLITLFSILSLSIGDVAARGPDERKDREKNIGSVHQRGGGGTRQVAPSVRNPPVSRPQPTGQFSKPGGGGYSKPNFSGQQRSVSPQTFQPPMNVKPGGGGYSKPNFSGQNRSVNPQTVQPQINVKPGAGGYPKPNLSGQNRVVNPQSFRPQRDIGPGGNRMPVQGVHPQPGQGFKNKPSQENVQRFLNLPKQNIGRQPGPGLGKVGAAALGGAAGAVALDHFLNRGRGPGAHDAVGHMPMKGGQPGQKLNPQNAQHIRDNYSQRYHNVFNKAWWAQHPHLAKHYWHNQIWPHHPWNYWWRPATWVALSSWIVWNWGPPLYYDYGSNFYYDNGYVYLNGRRLCSAVEYYDQAIEIVSKAPQVKDDAAQWMPLGVFALTQDPTKESNMVLQLAVNKDGNIQGTYYNSENDTTKPIKGMVDKQSQRAVWTFADDNNNAIIMETGIYNLTQDQTDVLVHMGKSRTEQWFLVRLPEPPAQESQVAPNPTQ